MVYNRAVNKKKGALLLMDQNASHMTPIIYLFSVLRYNYFEYGKM